MGCRTKKMINSNLNLNAGNSILAQYRENTMNDVLSGANNQNQQLAYLKTVNDLSNSNPNKVILDPIADNIKHWDDTSRGLTGAGTAVVAVAAVAATVASAGNAGVAVATAAGATTTTATGAVTLTATGSFIAASTTAAITATAATASVSATNASLNVQGNFFRGLDNVGKTTLKETTSKESLRNIAISAAVAGAASWAVNASGGKATMERGKDYAVYKPDPYEISVNSRYRDFVNANYPNYNGVIDPSVNNIAIVNTTTDITKIGTPVPAYSSDPFTKSFWQGFAREGGFISNNANKIGGINGMSTFHDPLTNNVFFETVPLATQITIPPAIAVEYCAISPAACGLAVSGSMNNQFGTKK